MKYRLVGLDGYIVEGRRIAKNEIIEVEGEVEEKIKNTGYFSPVLDKAVKEDSLNGFSFSQPKERPPRHIKGDWSYKRILVYLPGGLGDTVIGLSCISQLRSKPCEIVVLVNPRYIELGKLYDLDCKSTQRVSDTDYTYSFDYFISLECVYLKNSVELVDKDYYDAVFEEIGIARDKYNIKRPAVYKLNGRYKLDNKGYTVFVHAGASNPLRQWDRERWDKLVKILSENGINIYIGGQEHLISYQADNVKPLYNIPLLEQIYILSKSDFFIGVDSGFMHIAGQLGKEGVVLLGPTLPQHVCNRYKLRVISRGKCRGCRALKNVCKKGNKQCMNNIAVEDILTFLPRNVFKKNKIEQISIPTTSRYLKKKVSLLSKPRITWYLHKIGIGGGEIQVLRQARELRKWFDIEFLWYKRISEDDELLKSVFQREFKLKEATTINEIVKGISDCDIVITHSPYPEIYQAIEKLRVKPVVIRQIRSGSKVDLEMYYKYRNLIDLVFCVDKKVSEEVGGVWLPSSVIKYSGRKRRIFSNNFPTLGYAGRVDVNKGIDFIVSCVDKFDFNLVLFVDKIHHKRLLRTVNDKERIKMFDLSLDMSKFYNIIDCVVMNSEYEGSPTLILDGAYNGKPAITTDVGTLRDIFGDLLFYFVRNDEDSFGEALRRLKAEKVRRAELKKAVEKQNVIDTALIMRKHIRKAIGAVYGKINRVLITRWTGAGDYIMMSAFCNKIREMFPKAELWVQCNPSAYNIAKLYADVIVNNKQKPEADIALRQTYIGCWEKNWHAVEALGGCKDEIYLPLPKIYFKDKHKIKKPAVGFWIFQKHLDWRENIKEWKMERWEELAERLKEKGVAVYQLGALFEPKVDFLIDLRQDKLEESLYSLTFMDLVIGVESVVGHACNALGVKGVILFPNASDPKVVGYDTNINIVAKSKCKCYGAFDVKTIPSNCPKNCMDTISVDEVWEVVRKELKL